MWLEHAMPLSVLRPTSKRIFCLKIKMFFVFLFHFLFRFFISFLSANHWNHFLLLFFHFISFLREGYHNVHITKQEKWYPPNPPPSPIESALSYERENKFSLLNVILILFRFLDVIAWNKKFQVDIFCASELNLF